MTVSPEKSLHKQNSLSKADMEVMPNLMHNFAVVQLKDTLQHLKVR